MKTACPSLDLSIDGGPAQPLPVSGFLWNTTAVADGSHVLRAAASGGVTRTWTVAVVNHPTLLQMKSGYVRALLPPRPTQLSVTGTLAFDGLVPTQLPDGGAPWTFIWPASAPSLRPRPSTRSRATRPGRRARRSRRVSVPPVRGG